MTCDLTTTVLWSLFASGLMSAFVLVYTKYALVAEAERRGATRERQAANSTRAERTTTTDGGQGDD
jgi:hypothetical protein